MDKDTSHPKRIGAVKGPMVTLSMNQLKALFNQFLSKKGIAIPVNSFKVTSKPFVLAINDKNFPAFNGKISRAAIDVARSTAATPPVTNTWFRKTLLRVETGTGQGGYSN
ncbi:hypothetical protein EVAR_60017_1 [Eumeta japonica]|uniref:Uncharacterized protein n=1 Tax=Eumeta variegata TaxID=151549 RepID=A0A4C1ZL24_EUMVA|nr:hypothetical protein EVAR_60017_1 [Eumeta japonica]